MFLSHFIRKYDPIHKYSENRYIQIIYQASLVENMFTRDSSKVLDILKELTLGTDAETWIKGLKCVRKAMHKLQYHYDDTSEVERNNKVARADLRNIFYNNETTFTFEKYVKKLKGIFNVLEKYCVPLYEEQMVDNILYKIMSTNIELNTEVNIFRSSHLSIFVKASTYLSTVVARLYPFSNPSSGRFRKHSIYATGCGDHGSRRCGRFYVRGFSRGRGGIYGQGRGGHGRGGHGVGSGSY